MAIEVAKVELKSVQDASGMEALIKKGQFRADEVIAVIGKTEGNGGVNDFTRILADQAFRTVLRKHGSPEQAVAQIPMVWSGGCDGVIAAMGNAGIDDPADVHYVQTKTPLLTIDMVRDAHARGREVACEVHESMGVSNGTTGLGIAVALGEIEMPKAEEICRNLDLYSSVASCSSGVELTQAQIVLLGNKAGAGGR